ncbi:MAG: Uma2 family endonuclease [Isosphaeraceae bacterium]
MTRLANRPASQPDPTEPSPSSRKVYDRSSFEGDFLVQIPGQTAVDFELYAPESRFCEFFDGTVYMPSPVSDHHQEIVIFLLDLLNGLRWSGGAPIQVLTGPAVMRLGEDRKPEPDLFVRTLGQPESRALLVIEVISPSHRSYDLDFKAEHYRSAKLPEIWYVDHATRALIRDILGEAGYTREMIREGRIAATRLPGFWIDAGWLWSEPLPNPRACLQTILAALPA